MIKSVVSVLILLLLSFCSFGQDKVNFKHLTVKEGLASNHINVILKDAQGFLWFGTNTGLSRYDGYRFKNYVHQSNQRHSLLYNNVQELFIGFDQQLWVRTNKGNCVYDVGGDHFEANMDSILQAKGFPKGDVQDLIMDGQAAYLLYANGDFFYKRVLDGKQPARRFAQPIAGKLVDMVLDSQRKVLQLVSDKGELLTLEAANLRLRQQRRFAFERMLEHAVFKLFVDDRSGLWVYAKNFPFGALYYPSPKEEPLHFRQKDGDYIVNNDNISNIQQEGEHIWLATDHGGVNVFEREKKQMQYIVHESFNASSLPDNSTTALYKESDGAMWVGTYKGGVSYYHPELNFFSLYQQRSGQPNTLPFNDINCFAEDKVGRVWIGTNGGGLLCLDPEKQHFKSYRYNRDDATSISSDVIVSLLIDKEGQLWAGTYHGGLNKFEDGHFRRFVHAEGDIHGISDNSIWSLWEDSQDRFWVGTLSGGIDLFDPSTERFKRLQELYPEAAISSYGAKIMEDQRGNIWFGTSNGVLRLSKGGSVTLFDEQHPDFPLSNNVVSDLLEDGQGRIWVATQTGINILSADTITQLSTKEGLIDHVVVGLLLDDYGDVWVTTPKGISRVSYDGRAYRIQNYNQSDGLQASNFNERALYKLRDGRLLFGGSEGFNMYQPTPQRPAPMDASSMAVVDFHIQVPSAVDTEVQACVDRWLRSWGDKKRITVPPYIETFSILLSDFDFVQQGQAKVQYKLQGLSENWVDIEQMEISLSNLSAGDYTVWVRALQPDGLYSSPTALLEIRMMAPWWRSNWAYVCYGLLGLVLLLLFRKVEKMRARTRFNLLQAEEKARHAKEMEAMRTRFFTNVSHEFRTPISLIISPVQKLKLLEQDSGRKNYLDIIERNASSLLNLVNQLLDFNSIESKVLGLKLQYGDVFSVVRRIGEQFGSIAQTKNIQYTVDIPQEDRKVNMDFEKLERIVLNLLSNAFKFTPTGGKIRFLVEENQNDGTIRLEVHDTGIGIPKEVQARVFDRYFQVEGRWNAGEKGSGLGLAIVKEFVQLMGGEIAFVSQESEGTRVAICLPLEAAQQAPEKEREAGEKERQRKNLIKLMLVEDHADFTYYLQDNLSEYFQVKVFQTVEEAEKQLHAYHPDIIVCDLQLPGRSGIDFCREVRAQERSKHIPFVLITAVDAEEKEIEALKYGASDFMTKPFNFAVFLSKINVLLEQKELMEKRYRRQIDVKTSPAEIVDEDERFVLKTTQIIEEHLQDEDFSVEALAAQMNITRVGLYKKIVSITGYTPIEFIRNIRLNKALDLLKNTLLTVSEISYEVGFGNPKQFSKYFKNFYGQVPSSYRK